jgi:GMP synthase-like glutamine amidotransferase
LSRINKWYLDEQIKGEIVEELEVQRSDFTYTSDVIPISDPHIFSETQRMAQTQAVLALDQQYPGIMDRQAIVQRALKQLKVPNIKELMPNSPEPEELNAAEENVAMSLGRPAFAYIHQNHLAHLQTHLDYAKNPVYGANPLIAPSFQPRAIEHLKQHLVLWYSNQMRQYVEGALGQPVSDYGIPAITSQVDKLFALSSQHVNEDSQQVFEKVLPVLQAMVQQAAQYKPEPQLESGDQALLNAAMAETERKKARDEADITLKANQDQANNILKTREQQIKVSLNAIDNLTKERIETEKQSLEKDRFANQSNMDQERFKQEQFQTALSALQSAQSNQGEKK